MKVDWQYLLALAAIASNPATAAMMQSCRSVQPSCSIGWRATEDELTKDMVKPSLFYRPADEIASAIRGAKLAWTNEDDEEAESEKPCGGNGCAEEIG